MADDCIPLYEPGGRITGKTTAPVTGKRFLKISGNRTSGPGLSETVEGSNYQVEHADAAGAVVGVSSWTAATGQTVGIISTPGIVVPVRAAAAIAAFAEVEVGASGQAVPKAAGIAVGRCMTAAAINTDAEIKLY